MVASPSSRTWPSNAGPTVRTAALPCGRCSRRGYAGDEPGRARGAAGPMARDGPGRTPLGRRSGGVGPGRVADRGRVTGRRHSGQTTVAPPATAATSSSSTTTRSGRWETPPPWLKLCTCAPAGKEFSRDLAGGPRHPLHHLTGQNDVVRQTKVNRMPETFRWQRGGRARTAAQSRVGHQSRDSGR